MPKTKPTVGFYDLTGCQGCVLTFLFNEDELLDLATQVDIKAFRFAKGAKEEKQFDAIFVEGMVANAKDAEIVKGLREKTKFLVALGACACTGCIPAYRNYMEHSKYAYLVHEKAKEMSDVPPAPISMYVQVDASIPGCPPDKKQIATFIKDLLLGKHPSDYDRPVCFECRLNENRCLLDDGKMCLGPITRGGCNSICTNSKFECWGCRGPTPDANMAVMSKLLEQKGFSKEQVKQRMRTFAGMVIDKPQTLTTAKPIPEKKKPAKKETKKKALKTAKKKAAPSRKKTAAKKAVKKAKKAAKPKQTGKTVKKIVKKKAVKPAKKAAKPAKKAAKPAKKAANKKGASILSMIKKKLKR
jgi:coenzyme F420-reducing hydrogenase gamma subunit